MVFMVKCIMACCVYTISASCRKSNTSVSFFIVLILEHYYMLGIVVASGYVHMTTQPGLNSTWVEICHVFTRGRLKSRAKNSTSCFPTTRIIFSKGACKVHDKPLQPGLNSLHAFSAFFQPRLKSQPRLLTWVEIQPRLSCKRVIAFMCLMG